MHLVELRLGKRQFVRKVVRLVGEDFQVVGSSSLEAHLGQTSGVLGRGGQSFLLDEEFPVLVIGDKRVRNVAEGPLDCLLIRQKRFLLLGFRQAYVVLQTPALEDWLG